jgi:lipoyl(octanoyl) transferase
MTGGGGPRWEWRGLVPYVAALAEMRARREAVRERAAPEAIWLLEHPAVITTGRRPVPGLPSGPDAALDGVPVVATERGGLATAHGPGQLVGYLMVDAGRRGLGPQGVVERVEGVILALLDGLGIAAALRPGHRGVFVGRDKVCAIGLHFDRGVTAHGLALNLDPDLDLFSRFVPCGITDGGVTSVARLRGDSPPPSALAAALGEGLSRALGPLP